MAKERLKRQRLEMVRRFEDSELSRTEFCKLEGISTSCFDYWRAKARRRRETVGNFIEVKVEDSAPAERVQMPNPTLEVDLPMGVKLRFFEAGR